LRRRGEPASPFCFARSISTQPSAFSKPIFHRKVLKKDLQAASLSASTIITRRFKETDLNHQETRKSHFGFQFVFIREFAAKRNGGTITKDYAAGRAFK
jgi:hypothetical protein